MSRVVMLPVARWAIPVVVLLLVQSAFAQMFKPGEIIEYRVRGAVPPQWEFGVVIRPLDGGKQYLLLEKPTRFFPKGAEAAYQAADVRAPQIPKMGGTPGDPKFPGNQPIRVGAGLLSKQDVMAHAKEVFGPGDPFADGFVRMARLDKIRDFIKARGTTFLPDLDFENKEMPPGMLSVHIKSAIVTNYGKHPRVEDYVGTFLVGPSKRGTKAITSQGPKLVVSPEESARTEPGVLMINKDETYVWVLSRDHAPEKWVRGKWREAKTDEMLLWEGGPAIWLEKAHQTRDYMVRMCREPDHEGWIEVGESKARTSMQYGRRP